MTLTVKKRPGILPDAFFVVPIILWIPGKSHAGNDSLQFSGRTEGFTTGIVNSKTVPANIKNAAPVIAAPNEPV